jgi:hypothetical protein
LNIINRARQLFHRIPSAIGGNSTWLASALRFCGRKTTPEISQFQKRLQVALVLSHVEFEAVCVDERHVVDVLCVGSSSKGYEGNGGRRVGWALSSSSIFKLQILFFWRADRWMSSVIFECLEKASVVSKRSLE